MVVLFLKKKIFSKLNINDPKRYIVKANENMIIQYIEM